VDQPLTVSVLLTDALSPTGEQPQPSIPPEWRVVGSWADVDTELVMYLRRGDQVGHGSPEIVHSMFSQPDVAIAWSACAEEPRSLPEGNYPTDDCLTDVVEAQSLGPVLLRVSDVPRHHRDGGSLFEPLLATIGSGRAIVAGTPLLDTSGERTSSPPATAGSWRDPARIRPFGYRRRWHDPVESAEWLRALDRLAGDGTLSPSQELAVTTALLRRIVLLPDLAELGPMATHGVLIIDSLGARAEQLVQGITPRRAQPAIAVIDVGCDLTALPPAPWWEPEEARAGSVQLISQSALLAGPETDQDELRRFEVDMGGAR
jgi:hypothetical protein